MNSPRPEEQILDAALAKPRAERHAFIEQACGGDQQLLVLVQALMLAHERGAAAVPGPAPGAPKKRGMPQALIPGEKTGDYIGHYKLLQQLGEGGYGVVYMAEQEEPVRRRVALKVIKLGMDTRQVIARFEAERQALAMMDHPNIAKVLDAGTTETGRPYFVMELVRGIKVTEYCDQNNLPTEKRLDLFIHICKAIQHAHQKGIIHRDIKPSNILVTLHDGVPVPKVIDFGIAKAIEQRLTDKTLFTALEQFVGTPAYMSPEQAEMSGLDIDTRSDIYSLGVLLYELLTGKVPFEAKDLAAAGLEAMRRIIRERDPVPPSTRISTLGAAEQTTIARRRQTEAPKLIHFVRGDLDWIVMKCLEKDRTRRYETTNGLARDVERFLGNEPVSARPPSNYYRFRKLVRRNKVAVAAVCAVTGALIIGIAVSTWLYAQEKSAAARATRAESVAKVQANDQRTVMRFFLQNVLAAARPEGQEGGLGHEVTLRKAVEAAEPKIALQFTNQPLVEAEIRDTLGSTFMYLSDYSNAIRQAEWAIALVQTNMAPNDPQRLVYQQHLALNYLSAGQLTKAAALQETILSERRRLLGPEDPQTLASMDSLADVYQQQGRFSESLALLEDAVKLHQAKLGANDPQTMHCLQTLARAYREAGHYKESLQTFQELLEQAKSKFGPENPSTFSYMNDVAISYYVAGMYREAIVDFEKILELNRVKMGPAHAQTIAAMNSLAKLYREFGRLKDAVPMCEEAMELAKTNLGPDHPTTLKLMNNMAAIYSSLGQHAKSLDLWEETLKLQRAKLGPEHPDNISLLNNLSIAYGHLERPADAIRYAEEAVGIAKVKLGQLHSLTLSCVNTLANAYMAVGRDYETLGLREDVLGASVAKLGPDHPQTLTARHNLAQSYKAAGRMDDALRLLEENLEISKRKLGAKSPDTLNSAGVLAGNYMDAGRFADAERIFRELLPAQRARPAIEAPPVTATLALYGECLLRQDKVAEARPMVQECFDAATTNSLSGIVSFSQSLLGWVLLKERKYEEAEPLLLAGYEGMEQRPGKPPAGHKMLLSTTGENIISLYKAQGKSDEADQWRAKLKPSSAAESLRPTADAKAQKP